MNVTSGGLSFDFTATNEQLRQVVKDTQAEIQSVADAAKVGGKAMDAAMASAFDNIEKNAQKVEQTMSDQRQAIIALEAEIKNLRAQAGAAFEKGDVAASAGIMETVRAKERELASRRKVIDACNEANSALDAETARLNQFQQATQGATEKAMSLRQELRECREKLAQMEATQGVGVRTTEEFRALQQRAGQLADAMADAQAQVKIFSDDNAMITGTIASINGVAGAFSAAQGAMSLFGVENDKVQQAMLKVQSLMAITTGLQQVANAVNKDSAFMLTVVRAAKDGLATATTRLSVALGVSTVAAKALMATLTLGLSVAITAIIMLVDKYSSKTKEATKETTAFQKATEEFSSSYAKQSADLVGKYQKLRGEYKKLKTEHEKTDWIKTNANEMNNLGLAVNNTTDADNVFITNTKNVIKALELRAKALALQSMQMKAYEEYYKTVINADQTVAGGGFYTKYTKSNNWRYTNTSLTAEERAAGVTLEDFDKEQIEGQNVYRYKESQKVEDKINKYRMDQARQTNQRIRNEAQQELDKTVKYVEKELTANQEAINALAVLKPKTTTTDPKGGGGGGKGGGSEEDQFKKLLATREGLYDEYVSWVTSGDATVREAAKTEFSALLDQGQTYLEFLTNLRDQISAKETQTAIDQAHLRLLNDEIAQATKDAVVKDFQDQLNADLAACQTLGQMLDLIAQRRQDIAGDPEELKNRKEDVLGNAETSTKGQIESETRDLLQTYASYELQRYEFAQTYARKRELLEKALAEATTEAQQAAARAALAALEEQNNKYSQATTGLYATLREQYQSHEAQLAAIRAKYAAQRNEAQANGDIAMLQAINAAEAAEVSKMAANQLMASDAWSQLFSDISRMGTRAIARLISTVENNKVQLSAQMNPADLKAIEDQLERARQELQNRNPFLALRDSLAELRRSMNEKKILNDKDDPILQQLEERRQKYEQIAANLADPITAPSVAIDFKADLDQGTDFADYLKRRIASLGEQKVKLGAEFTGQHELDVLIAMLNKVQGTSRSVGDGLKDTFSDTASAIKFISGTFDSVVSGLKKMGVEMDAQTEAILGDIGGIMEGASQVAEGIASGNPLSIIQGSISLITSAFDLFNSRDRKAEASIKKHQEALSKLKNTYNELTDAVKRALGEEVYSNQSAVIANLRSQQAELSGMMAAERSKKKTDKSKLEEWGEQYKELGRQIEDVIDTITQSITQTSAKDLAGNLADALVEAFEGGKNSAKAFGEVANNVIKNAVINALKLQLLEKPLQEAIKRLQQDMGFDEEGNGSFDGLSESEQKRFKEAVEKAGANFQAAMEMYKGLWTQLDATDPTTLSGAIKGASQESIDLLAGQTNAVRQNQVTSLELLRQQLLHLSNIDANVGVIAGRLLSILNRINQPSGTDLRSQGITE